MVNWDGRNEQIIILGWDSARSDLHLYTLHSVYLSSVLETSRTSIIFIIISQYRRGKKNHQTIYDVDMCCELDVCDQLRVKMTTSHLTEHRKKIIRLTRPPVRRVTYAVFLCPARCGASHHLSPVLLSWSQSWPGHGTDDTWTHVCGDAVTRVRMSPWHWVTTILVTYLI